MKHHNHQHQQSSGNSASHHFPMVRYFMLSDRITPMAGCSGDRPNPRNVILASCKIACGNISTIPTKPAGEDEASYALMPICHGLIPILAAIFIKWLSFSCITSARISRAREVQCVRIMPVATPLLNLFPMQRYKDQKQNMGYSHDQIDKTADQSICPFSSCRTGKSHSHCNQGTER